MYILTNKNNTVLYIGVTNDLRRRQWEHEQKLLGGFTCKYNVNKLVYYEDTNDVKAAIAREKVLKKWSRKKKKWLIETMNPDWRDLKEDL